MLANILAPGDRTVSNALLGAVIGFALVGFVAWVICQAVDRIAADDDDCCEDDDDIGFPPTTYDRDGYYKD